MGLTPKQNHELVVFVCECGRICWPFYVYLHFNTIDMVSDKSFPTFVPLIKAHFCLTWSFPLQCIESIPLLD